MKSRKCPPVDNVRIKKSPFERRKRRWAFPRPTYFRTVPPTLPIKGCVHDDAGWHRLLHCEAGNLSNAVSALLADDMAHLLAVFQQIADFGSDVFSHFAFLLGVFLKRMEVVISQGFKNERRF